MHSTLFYCFLLLLLAKFSASQNISKPGCPARCGNVTIPYPFGVGIGSNCSMSPWFDIYCDDTVSPPYMLISTRDDYRLIDISDSRIRIRIPYFSSRCESTRNNSTNPLPSNLTLDFSNTPYTLSESNRLTLIGCSDLAVLDGLSMQYPAPNLTQNNFASGCVSFCSDGDQSRSGSCPGNGCCQLPVPKGTVLLNASISGLQERWGGIGEKPCSYSFLGEQNSFAFQAVSDLYQPPFSIVDWLSTVPVNLDWKVGTQSCSEAARDLNTFACRENSYCIDADAGVGGYRCRCLEGYQGNPYLPQGCQDIDECSSINPCHATGICINVPGNYSCGCPSAYYGNGGADGTGCLLMPISQSKLSKLSIGLISGTGLLALLSLSFWLLKFIKKRKIKKRKQKFFKENGGLLLRQETSANEGILRKTRIFTAKELEKATDRFNESRILGRGGQGTVYKGMLSNGEIVAIKKSQLVDENKSKHLVKQFINEVVILSQINHRNVVKLLGCCLETKVPLLVYEFVSNGTLFQLINDKNIGFPVSWTMRLKIAVEVAGALAYLHTATSVAIFHRDVKSSNILLDEKFVAKVSDFGTSKSVEVDQTHLTTQVNGTFGYIDPEYFRSSQFTEKSDVYSFGVVLVELLTGLKPILSSNDTEVDKSLVSRFLTLMKENNLELILDREVSGEVEKEEVLVVAKLAKRCLHLNGKKRPTMKEVAMELEGVRMSQTDRTKLPEDLSFRKSRSTVMAIDDADYNWTNTSDLGTISTSSDNYPILFDTN